MKSNTCKAVFVIVTCSLIDSSVQQTSSKADSSGELCQNVTGIPAPHPHMKSLCVEKLHYRDTRGHVVLHQKQTFREGERPQCVFESVCILCVLGRGVLI